MKKPFSVITLIFFFSCAVLSASNAGQAAGPRMSIEENYFNFKEVTEGSVLTHTFRILNKGDQPLKIRKVSPG